jgi:tetratricopeptide (TPR) repeat protein
MTEPRRAAGLSCAAALLGLLPWALADRSPVESSETPNPDPSSATPAALQEDWANRDEAKGAAIEAIRSDDLARARAILGELLVEDYLVRVGEFLERDDPAGALLWADRALDLNGESEAALLAKADGLMALAEQLIAQGQGGAFVMGYYEDALRTYSEANGSVEAGFGRARAAYALNRAEDSLRFAQGAMERLGDRPVAPEQQAVLARAAYLVFAEEAQSAIDGDAEADPVRRAKRYGSAEEALIQWTGLAPEDAESWGTLGNLYLFESSASGDPEFTVRAREALELGLERNPADSGLLRRVVDTARRGEGFEGSIAALERQLSRAPESTEARYMLARERFDLGLDRFPGTDASADAYAAARETFASARDGFAAMQDLTVQDAAEAEVNLSNDARGWRVMSQNALGWVGYWQGDLAAAERDFLATSDILTNGLEWQITGVLESGLRGLEFVMDGYNRRGNIQEAARVALLLHELKPEDPTFANHAGLFNRDAASAMEIGARTFCAAARGELSDFAANTGQEVDALLANLRAELSVAPELVGTAAEKRLFRERADVLLARAWELVEHSTSAYLAAVELTPDDPAVLNDASVMFLYHSHRDIDRAEELLLRCLEVSEELLSDESLPEDERAVIVERWGDAHENLGVLHWFYRQDGPVAREWFERALEIGPYPRVVVTEVYLPLIEADAAGEPPPTGLPPARDVLGWGAPCE